MPREPRATSDLATLRSKHPGEHWQSDLLIWGLVVFGEPVDGLLREVFGRDGCRALDAEPWLPVLVGWSHRTGLATAGAAELQGVALHLRRRLADHEERARPPRRRGSWGRTRQRRRLR